MFLKKYAHFETDCSSCVRKDVLTTVLPSLTSGVVWCCIAEISQPFPEWQHMSLRNLYLLFSIKGAFAYVTHVM